MGKRVCIGSRSGFVSVPLIIGAAILVSAIAFIGFDAPRARLTQTASLIGKTFRDIFDIKAEKPVLEIELIREKMGGRDDKSAVSPGSTDTGKKAVPIKFQGSKTNGAAAPMEAFENKGGEDKEPERSPAVSDCDFNNSSDPSRKLLFNEIGWMGSQGSANDEWFEIMNNSRNPVSLSGWRIMNQGDGINILFGEGDSIQAGSFYLLERTDDGSIPGQRADKIYTGAISNNGEWMKFFDAQCNLVDEIDARSGWAAFGGDNSTKKTLERNFADFGWHTSDVIGGTPRTQNSTSPTRVSPSPAQPTYYALNVSKTGDGAGVVTSDIGGINCGAECGRDYQTGSQVELYANPAAGSAFNGWQGACSGIGVCTIAVIEPLSVTAIFLVTSPPPPQNVNSAQHIVISEIMAGTSVENDDEFIELYNPGDQAADLSLWSLKKKSSTGSESSLVVASRLQGKTIPPKKYFLIARDGGYAGSAAPDALWPASASYALAYTNNSLLLYNAQNELVEEVSWTEIPKDQSFERESWSSNQFKAQFTPTPRNSQN